MKRKNEDNRCGECRHAKLIEEHWNKSLDGKYIAFRCPHQKGARLDNEKACSKFEPQNSSCKR